MDELIDIMEHSFLLKESYVFISYNVKKYNEWLIVTVNVIILHFILNGYHIKVVNPGLEEGDSGDHHDEEHNFYMGAHYDYKYSNSHMIDFFQWAMFILNCLHMFLWF